MTLVTGTLAMSVAGVGPGALTLEHWAGMLAGIAAIGMCNLGVSFGLAFGMALRARRMPTRRGVVLLAQTALSLLRRPRNLLRIPPSEAVEGAH